MSIESNLKNIAESQKAIAIAIGAIAVYLVSDDKEKEDKAAARIVAKKK